MCLWAGNLGAAMEVCLLHQAASIWPVQTVSFSRVSLGPYLAKHLHFSFDVSSWLYSILSQSLY